MSNIFKVALAGLGTVGGGVVKLLLQHQEILLQRCFQKIELTDVADLNEARVKQLNIPESVRYYKDAAEMVEKTDADVVIELVVVATITDEGNDYAKEVLKALKKAGIRAEADLRNEKINYKIREHSLKKVPVMLVIGKKEIADGTVTIRRLGQQNQETLALDEVIAKLKQEAVLPHIDE